MESVRAPLHEVHEAQALFVEDLDRADAEIVVKALCGSILPSSQARSLGGVSRWLSWQMQRSPRLS